MAHVLVIGGNLFIGRALVERLLERGDEVTVMHRGRGTPFGNRVSEIQCDRNDADGVRDAMSGRSFDVVFDNVYDWQRGTTAEQVGATAIAAAEGGNLKRYVFMSSIAVYPPGGEYDEDAPLVPAGVPNPYSAQKAESERLLFELHARRGIPVTTLRPAFIYGPHNPFDREAFFWDRLQAGRRLIVPEHGQRAMQWVDVRDVAHAAVSAASESRAVGRAYNLASSPPLSQIEYVHLLARVAGKPANVVFVPRADIERHGGQLFAPPLYFGVFLDIEPIVVRSNRTLELGVRLRPLEDGLRETYRWYRQQERPQPDYSWEDGILSAR